jgi:IS30 family transposase
MISQRPAEAADRADPGHWEGDKIIGLHSLAIGTLVERTTRFTMLLHLPPMAGHLAGARKIQRLPAQLRGSLTWDQGAELAQRVQLRIDKRAIHRRVIAAASLGT